MNREQRFWAKVSKSETCWLWQGVRPGGRYGQMRWQGELEYAHRIAWELAFGPIPAANNVLHRCDNPGCVNPDHLFLGTQVENIEDAISKGRIHCRQNGLKRRGLYAKLSPDDVRLIRSLRAKGVQRKVIAKRFNVSLSSIAAVLSGRCWADVKDADGLSPISIAGVR